MKNSDTQLWLCISFEIALHSLRENVMNREVYYPRYVVWKLRVSVPQFLASMLVVDQPFYMKLKFDQPGFTSTILHWRMRMLIENLTFSHHFFTSNMKPCSKIAIRRTL